MEPKSIQHHLLCLVGLGDGGETVGSGVGVDCSGEPPDGGGGDKIGAGGGDEGGEACTGGGGGDDALGKGAHG
ncbi:hypothetical protein L6452_20126 [Arctium lappa]|uniref:Uncharacterized protein n=1 Tax=Arctium lappa TaxID=4217 RepID=A0ACB9BBU8_ARCLA|nr:hypothetical protein L6452_20126 [Arctium lappa]